MGPKTILLICGICMKLVTKYQISAINSFWEKCDEKCAYMFNVYRNKLSRQTGSRNLTGPKMLPTIWHTYMKLVTKYQIPVINSCWDKCDYKWAYMFNVYTTHFSQKLLMAEIWYLVTSFIQIPHIRRIVFGPIRFLLPVCRLCWFYYTLNIYAHFSSHFSQQLLMAEIWYLVTSFI
jgi:hypothetical protein